MKFGAFNSVDRFMLLMVATVLFFAFPASLLRLSGVEFFFNGTYFNIVFGSFFLVAMSNMYLSRLAPLPARSFAIALLAFVVLVFTIGVVLGNDGAIGGLKYFGLPLVVYLLLLGRRFVLFFYTSDTFWKIILGSHLLCLVFYYTTLFGRIYPGIGVPSISFAAIFFLARGRLILFALSLMALVGEGKRSLLLALLVTMVFMRLIRLNVGSRLIYSLFGFTVLLVAASIGLEYISNIQGSSIINRINLLNPFSDSYDILMGSSGRAGELVSYFAEKNLWEVVIGSGSGFTYEWNLGYDSSQNGEIKGYFHMSPANYLAAGGFLGLVPFFWMMLLPFRAGAMRAPQDVQTVAFSLGVFCVIQSFFGYNLATDPISLIFIFGPMMLVGSQKNESYAPAVSGQTLERPV